MKKAVLGLVASILMSLSPWAVAGKSPAPESIEGAETISVEKAKELFDQQVLFLDVRKDKDWDAGRIPGASHLEVKKKMTQEALAKLVAKDEPVVMYCNGEKCHRSAKASKKAVGWGYTKVYYFRGGLPAWKAAGLPVE